MSIKLDCISGFEFLDEYLIKLIVKKLIYFLGFHNVYQVSICTGKVLLKVKSTNFVTTQIQFQILPLILSKLNMINEDINITYLIRLWRILKEG